jgi:hypothetical protein
MPSLLNWFFRMQQQGKKIKSTKLNSHDYFHFLRSIPHEKQWFSLLSKASRP